MGSMQTELIAASASAILASLKHLKKFPDEAYLTSEALTKDQP